MPDSIINPEKPNASFAEITTSFYTQCINKATSLIKDHPSITPPELNEVTSRFSTRINNFSEIDKKACIELQDSAVFKNAILPEKLPATDTALSEKQKDDALLAAQEKNTKEVLDKYKDNFDAALKKLEKLQEEETIAFDNQLRAFVDKVTAYNKTQPADKAIKIDTFADEQRTAFKDYQKKQRAGLAELYNTRQENFTNRVINAPNQLNSLIAHNGRNQTTARNTLVESSKNGDGSNPQLAKHDKQLIHRFSIPLSRLIDDKNDHT
ncbi:MAG: hypothetical protein ACK4PR_08980, partial [Gammaproteobacteria bacterium]